MHFLDRRFYMRLRKTGKTPHESNTHIKVERMGLDFILISVINDERNPSRSSSYWFLRDDSNNPPLDISVNEDSGAVMKMTLFVDTNCFGDFQLSCDEISYGNILVDLSGFSKTYDIVETKGSYYVSLVGEKLFCKFGESIFIKETIVNGDIEFYVDDINELVGFAINGLKEEEIRTIFSIFEV